MKLMLLTRDLREKLEHNALQVMSGKIAEDDLEPVVKLFHAHGAGKWLFTELRDGDRLFGLCDRGNGHPELGHQSLRDMQQLRAVIWGRRTNVQAIEREAGWSADGHTLADFTEASRARGKIVDRLPGREAA